MASILSLPNELNDLTAIHLATGDIDSLMSTCHSLHSSAIPALYNTFTLVLSEETVNGHPKVLCLLRSFVERPRTARMVRKLEAFMRLLAASARSW